MNNEQTVFIVDDDDEVRQSLTCLMRSMGLESESFDSAEDFLHFFDPMRSGCLLLDVRPGERHARAGCHAHACEGMIGLDLLEHINKRFINVPAIVISVLGDVPTVVRAMRAGALNFLHKPCSNLLLWQSIQECFKWDAANRRRLIQAIKVTRRLEQLTTGEYEVLEKVLEGKSNKTMAADLCVSVRTVEVRRAKTYAENEGRFFGGINPDDNDSGGWRRKDED